MKPEEFPYITELKVNDCYAYKDFAIPFGEGDGKSFRHLILTGRNGSGKTTILRRIDYWMKWIVKGIDPMEVSQDKNPGYWESNDYEESRDTVDSLTEHRKRLNDVSPVFRFGIRFGRGAFASNSFIFAYYIAQRKTDLKDVETVTKESEIVEKQHKKDFSTELKQFLANKKIYQAFDMLENRIESAKLIDRFFLNLEKSFQDIFEDTGLSLKFVKEEFEFYLVLSDGRQITLNDLPDGFSALYSIFLELLIRVEIIRQIQKDNQLEPCGIVLIDEPESHLHIELQYKVMPLLTSLFPNIQFIVATHSPAVVSSLTNATIFDLTKQEAEADWVVGSSFSELMVKHFGLDNEYSDLADKVIGDIQRLVDSHLNKKDKLAALKKILIENEKYLSASMMLSVETDILNIEEMPD